MLVSRSYCEFRFSKLTAVLSFILGVYLSAVKLSQISKSYDVETQMTTCHLEILGKLNGNELTRFPRGDVRLLKMNQEQNKKDNYCPLFKRGGRCSKGADSQ